MEDAILRLQHSDKVNFDSSDVIIRNQEILEKYKTTIEPLKELLNKFKENVKSNRVNELFDEKDNWGQKFYYNCRDENDKYLDDKKFFGLLDIDKVISCIKRANSYDISNFRYGIGHVYNFSNIYEFYKNDLPNLYKFYEELSKVVISELGITKKLNIELLMKLLDDKIKLIEHN